MPAGPWEEYQTAKTPPVATAERGPWQDYAAPTATANAPGWFEQAVHATANALSNFGHDMNPVNIAAGMGAFVDPATAKNAWLNLGRAQDEMRVKAADSFSKGDYLTGVRQTAAWLFPVIGPQMENIAEQADKGDYSGAVGRTAAFGTQMYLGTKAPAILEAAPDAVSAAVPIVKGAIKEGYQAAKGSTPLAIGADWVAQHAGAPAGTVATLVSGPRVVAGIVRGARAGMPEALRLDSISQSLAGKAYADLAPAEQTAVRSFRNAEHATAVNDIAQSLGGKDYLKLTPAEQTAVRSIPNVDEAATVNQVAQSIGGKDFLKLSPEQQQGVQSLLTARRAAQTRQLLGVERTPAWQNAPEAQPQAVAAPAPLSEIALPSGRVPGGYPGELAPAAAPPPRVPAWQSLGDTVRLGAVEEGPLPQPVRPARPAPPPRPAPVETTTPTETPAAAAPGSSLSDLVDAARGVAKRKAPVPEPAPAPAPAPAAPPQPAPEFQTPVLEGLTATEPGAAVNVYKQRAQVLKAQRFANTLEAEGLPFAKTREWTPDDWKAHAEKVGENAPSQDTVNQILAEQQIRESKQAFESARAEGLSKAQRFLAAMNERNVTYADSLKWGPGEWNQFAAELGENKPMLKEIQNIRAKLKYQESHKP